MRNMIYIVLKLITLQNLANDFQQPCTEFNSRLNSLDKYQINTRLQTLFFKGGTLALVSRFTHGAAKPFRRYFGLRLWQVGAMFQILSPKLYVCLAVCSYSRPSGRWHAVSNANRMPRSPLLHLGIHLHLFLSGPFYILSVLPTSIPQDNGRRRFLNEKKSKRPSSPSVPSSFRRD